MGLSCVPGALLGMSMPQPCEMLEQGEVTFGLGLMQHCIPNNCLQG